MAGKVERYREILRALEEIDAWETLLLEESALPGPRGNLELVQAAVEEGSMELFLALLERAPATTGATGEGGEAVDPRREFLAVCGAAGLGRLVARGERSLLPLLRHLAGDPRWRVREGVAMALQRWGDEDMAGLLEAMEAWACGTLLERRAVVAGLCEPRLLRSSEAARRVLALLDSITADLSEVRDRRDQGFQPLRKALGYGWSVAAVADLPTALPLMERWLAETDRDVQWVMRQNLSKARLERAASVWVAEWRPRLGGTALGS